MRKTALLFPLILQSHLIFAGGFSGGGPPPLLLDRVELRNLMQADSRLETIAIHPDDFRRIKARLSIGLAVSLDIGPRQVALKENRGGITDGDESLQLMPSENPGH